jgi:hypothetical protein
LKKGDTYSTGVTAIDVSGWEEVPIAEYEAWKEAEKAKAENYGGGEKINKMAGI